MMGATGGIMGIIRGIATSAELEIRRLRHDPLEVFTRAVQPILWLAIFAEIIGSRINLPINVNYATYIAPGVLVQSAMFVSLAYGILLVWERDSGILKRLLTAPLPRIVVVTGRALAGAIRASTQLPIILAVAFAIGANLCWSPINILLALVVLLIGCMGVTAISILIASLLKTRERFMGLMNAVAMPLFFTSNALYPVEIMPLALRMVALGNPLTYIVDALRGLLIYNNCADILLDVGIVAAFTASSIIIASIWFRRIIE